MTNATDDSRFQRGRKKAGGRKAGTPNKASKVYKEALLLAAEAVGDEINGKGLVGYLMWAAIEHPAVFIRLLARLIPIQEAIPPRDFEAESFPRIFETDEAIRQETKWRRLPDIADVAIRVAKNRTTTHRSRRGTKPSIN